ncbi:MAG: glycerophosphodiester phosphodiesterase family protein [Pyrinomonadaceae bacterium]
MSTPLKRPLIIAHRGSSAAAPENTIAAFERAMEDGAEGIEFDVRITRDGIPVVFHDSSLKRIASNEERITSLFSREMPLVDVGSWFNRANPEFANRKYIGEPIPTLEKTLDVLAGFEGPIYVEIKTAKKHMRKMAGAVGELLKARKHRNKFIVKSFEPEVMPLIREITGDIELAGLFAPTVLRLLRKEKKLVPKALGLGFERLSIHFSMASRELMRAANALEMPVTVWTVDSRRIFRKCMASGIDSVITNNPAKMLVERDGAFVI